MKILIVSEFIPFSFLGGLARHAITLGNQFIKDGHEVDILGNGEYGTQKQISDMGFSGDIYLDKTISGSRLIRRIERYLKIYPVWLHIMIARRIARTIIKYAGSYDVIHYHGHYPIVACYVPTDINLVITHHDYSLSCPKKTFLRNNVKPCVPGKKSESCADCQYGVKDILRRWLILTSVRQWRTCAKKAILHHKHIFVSKRLSEINLAVLSQGGSRVYIVHNFIDCDLLQQFDHMCPVVESLRKKMRIVILNNLDPHKGIKEFLEETQIAGLLNDEVEIIIAGDGSQREVLEVRYSVRSVQFMGHLSYSDAINLVRSADIYLLASICEESCSTGVLEALYLGKDVRALNRGGTPELAEYAFKQSQLKLYNDTRSLVESIKTDVVYVGKSPTNTNFGGCVTQKKKKILKIYEQ